MIVVQSDPDPRQCKSVSVWQREFSKIVERRTFDLINYARKYVKLDKMVKSTTIDNLGTNRTENLLINIKYLIRSIPREFNFRGIRLFGKFSFLNFCRD